jgi:hypothetical protein
MIRFGFNRPGRLALLARKDDTHNVAPVRRPTFHLFDKQEQKPGKGQDHDQDTEDDT